MRLMSSPAAIWLATIGAFLVSSRSTAAASFHHSIVSTSSTQQRPSFLTRTRTTPTRQSSPPPFSLDSFNNYYAAAAAAAEEKASSTALFSSTRLFYRDDKHEDPDEALKKKQKKQEQEQIAQQQQSSEQQQQPAPKPQSPPPPSILSIPVLGPFLTQPPLLLGSDFMLDSPTPLQWQSLEEAHFIHHRHLSAEEQAGIDAAPLIAVLDESTAPAPMTVWKSKGDRKAIPGRYATICAVVGITSSSSSSSNDDDSSSEDSDTKSAEEEISFMQSIRKSKYERDAVNIQSSRVRLVAIGRAVVHSFFHQIPTAIKEATMDEEGHLILQNEEEMQQKLVKNTIDNEEEIDIDVEDDEDEHDTAPMANTNIVMAQFQLLSDQLQSQAGGTYVSPLHAVAEMSKLANQLHYMHNDRRKLVAAITTAKARLRLRDEREKQQQESGVAETVIIEEELFDYDGIGALFASRDEEVEVEDIFTLDESSKDEGSVVLDALLEEFKAKVAELSPASTVEFDLEEEEEEDEMVTESSSTSEADVAEQTSFVASLENYGMGCSATAVSPLTDLTQVWLNEKLSPYYSPEKCSSEEMYYEVFSFVAILSMQQYLTPSHLAWAVTCSSSIERLNVAYEWMMTHKQLLQQEANGLIQQLLDCGEECTDLF